MICAVMEAAEGMPTALAGAAQLRATLDSSCSKITFLLNHPSPVKSRMAKARSVLLCVIAGSLVTEKLKPNNKNTNAVSFTSHTRQPDLVFLYT